jgi:hypothetical protein
VNTPLDIIWETVTLQLPGVVAALEKLVLPEGE